MTRCLWNVKNGSSSDLDTSPNAQFYQRCLVWQHPSLPGVSLFPRDGTKMASAPTLSRSSSASGSSTGPYADPRLSASLHASWCESIRSLHQLIRVRQCAYFYVCAPTFTVLYRAAGVCGIPHAHALITPTTRGLRNAMREEGEALCWIFFFFVIANFNNFIGTISEPSFSPSLMCFFFSWFSLC